MNNPWKDINLSDYEGHMNLESVNQLPVLRKIFKEQLQTYDIQKVMVLGIAGGAGLEHVSENQLKKIYGIDINEGFLAKCKERFSHLYPMLELLQKDLMDHSCELPSADLVVCNLVAEYIGYEALMDAIKKSAAKYASVVIQVNKEEGFVSTSPYLKSFERLNEVHCLMEEELLVSRMSLEGYEFIFKKIEDLPNGKILVRLDFSKKMC